MWLLLGLLLIPSRIEGPGPLPRVPAEFASHPRLADAARVLAQSETGRAVIARYLATDYVLVVGRSSLRASNTRSILARLSGHPPDFLTDHLARQVILFNDTLPAATVAVGLTHEIIHVLGGARPGTRALGEEELHAWNVALDFYLGLPDSLRAVAAPKYGAYARWRQQRPEEFALTMRCQYPDTPGCPGPAVRQGGRLVSPAATDRTAAAGPLDACGRQESAGPGPRPSAPDHLWMHFLAGVDWPRLLVSGFANPFPPFTPCLPGKPSRAS